MFRFSLLALLLACAVTHVAYSSSSDISWDLSASYREKGKSKKILDHVQGTASSGSLHAIMGPSGSGKSTVISILSNTVPKGSLKIIGYVAKALALEEVEPIFVARPMTLTAIDTPISAIIKLPNKARASVHL